MIKRAYRTMGRLAVLATALVGLVASTQSCVFDNTGTDTCKDGRICPPGWTCATAQGVCIDDGCGNGIVEPPLGEICDDGNVEGNDGCSADCKVLENCGNGTVDEGEVCDDGNIDPGDGCNADCQSDETCGNDYKDDGEVCDDGNNESGDGCSADCQKNEKCGDGKVDENEVCDDGNNESGDDCSENCISIEICGNGYHDVEEECDDGNDKNDDACVVDCKEATCGDDFLWEDMEECDNGDNNNYNPNSCRPEYCTLPVCGDGIPDDKYIVNPDDDEPDQYTEECDDGNDDNADNCVEGCKLATCGDGFVNKDSSNGGSTEECDPNAPENSCGPRDCIPAGMLGECTCTEV